MERLQRQQYTVTGGLFTDGAHAVVGHVEKRDFEHHDAVHSALILGRAATLGQRCEDQ